MKLKLEVVRDINVLVASGPIEPANFAVLKAGIKKLFKDGKNKIILELPDSSTLSTAILREFAVMNLLASELAGQIILAEISPLTRAKIESFSKPPIVRCFANRAAAVEFFHPKTEEAPSTVAPAATGAAAPAAPADKKMNLDFLGDASKGANPAAAPSASGTLATPGTAAPGTSAPTTDPNKQAKSDLRAKELGDIGELRKRANDVETENKELKKELAKLVVTRRDPPDLDAWKEKVTRLEKELAEAIQVAQNATSGKK